VTHGKSRSKPAVTMQDVRTRLATMDKGTLADMLVDQAMEDDRLRQRLLMKAARKGPKGLDVATYRRAIDEAVDAGGFVDYRAVEKAIESVDDSDGHMGGILERLQEIHHEACKKAKPEPEALARRLFEWELRTDWDTFHGAAQTYARILGEEGLAVYRKLAEAEWAKVLAVGHGGRLLFVVIVVRKDMIRVISARDMNRKERKVYESS